MQRLMGVLLEQFYSDLNHFIEIESVREKLMGVEIQYKLRHSRLGGARMFTREELGHLLTTGGYGRLNMMIEETKRQDDKKQKIADEWRKINEI